MAKIKPCPFCGNKLKPCPFCGNKPYVYTSSSFLLKNKCSCENKKCPIFSIDIVISAWNRRVNGK